MGGYPADDTLGIDGFLTPGARRLICLAGGQRSFANAEHLLRELCGWHVSDERIRQACHAEAARIADWRSGDDAAVAAAFVAAKGDVEFQTDATKVNTDTGWRDMKIGVFAKRPAGVPAEPAEWDERTLPPPTSRVAFAAVEEIEAFAPRWGEWAERLGVADPSRLSVLGDGAEWIWNAADTQFPGHRGALDIYHACEHLAATAAALHGADTDASRAWLAAGRTAVLADGWWGLCEHVGRTLCATTSAAGRTSVDELMAYFAKHTQRLNYRSRLQRGEAIGSGLIEGACKQMIGRRMKQTGARWTVPNANRMAELCSLTYSDQWAAYWNAA